MDLIAYRKSRSSVLRTSGVPGGNSGFRIASRRFRAQGLGLKVQHSGVKICGLKKQGLWT